MWIICYHNATIGIIELFYSCVLLSIPRNINKNLHQKDVEDYILFIDRAQSLVDYLPMLLLLSTIVMYIVTVCVFVCHVFSYHPFYFDFHSTRIIFDVSSGFYLWNVNRTTTWHLSKMLKFAFKDVSTKNSEPTYWTILKIYFIYKVAEKKSRRAI